MRNSSRLDPATSVISDELDLLDSFEGEAFDRFEQQMDEALELLVGRWIDLAAPAARISSRPTCLFGKIAARR